MPDFYLFGGPNGAGKTTVALRLLPSLGCHEFVNADALASALSPFRSESVAFRAGVLMMKRLRELAGMGENFASESTLAARAWVPFVKECQTQGYSFNLIYIWLSHSDLAVQRVAHRVRAGGHDIPEETIRRRYEAGQHNFVSLYLPLADKWWILNNTKNILTPVAKGENNRETIIYEPEIWQEILK